MQEEEMLTAAHAGLGSVAALWRYPVKSMMGEELTAAEVTDGGLVGDRAYALVDSAGGKVASAKNPRKWPHLFDFRAALTDAASESRQVPAVRITLPDGTTVISEQPDVDRILSQALEREVSLHAAERRHPEVAEEYWPDLPSLEHRDTVTDFSLPEGTFFDSAVVHVLTTATLDQLGESYPDGRFDPRRFRPNIVVQTADGVQGFAEDAWIGRTLYIGDTVRLRITGSCPRCVMITLAQGDLPADLGILRTAAQRNGANVGVYASVVQSGRAQRGDAVRLE